MRIDSTDASTAVLPKNNTDDGFVRNSRPAPVQKTKIDEKGIANISHISEFEKRELPISEQVVINAIEKANRAISVANRKFEYSIHEKTKEIMIKVIDSDTNEVVREIPPEKVLDMVAKMWEMAGLVVDERR